MEPEKSAEIEGLQGEHDNQFLPKDPNSYLSMEMDHEQRRSLILANDHFFPQHSRNSHTQSETPGEALVGAEASLGAFQSRKEEDGDEEGCHQDEENQFMLDHDRMKDSINQGLINSRSNPVSEVEMDNKITIVNKQSNSFPLVETSQMKSEEYLGENLQSNVEPYFDPNPREETQSHKNQSSVFPSNHELSHREFSSKKDESKAEVQLDIHHQAMERKGEPDHQQDNQFLQSVSGGRQSRKEFLLGESHASFSKKPQSDVALLESQPLELQVEKERQIMHDMESNQLPLEGASHLKHEQESPEQPVSRKQSQELKQKSQILPLQPGVQSNLESSNTEGNRYKTRSLIQSGPIFAEPESSLHQAKSSIIKRIVIDDSPSRKTIEGEPRSEKKFQLQIEPASEQQQSVDKESQEKKEGAGIVEDEKVLVESQVVKFERPSEELSFHSEHQMEHSKRKQQPQRKEMEQIELDENQSRFLEPIQQSMRSIKSVHEVCQIQSSKLQPKQASFNLSNMILDPVPAESGRDSSNINLDSSIKEKKVSESNSSAFGKNSSRYQEGLSEFRKEQVRRMQERSSIEHLHSNITEGDTPQINTVQEAHYSVGQNQDPYQVNSSLRQKEPSIDEKSSIKPPIEAVQYEEQLINDPPPLLSPDNIREKERDSDLEDFNANKSNLSKKEKVVQEIKHQQSISPSVQIPSEMKNSSKINSFKVKQSFFDPKQEIQTANVLASNNQIDSAYPKESEFSQKKSKHTKKAHTLVEVSKNEVQVKQSQEKPAIFNTYPEQPQPQDFNEFEENHEEQESYEKKIIRTPQEKVKFDRLNREKIHSNKDPYPLTSKKKEKGLKNEDKDDQIQRMKIIKEAHKKRLERQLQKVEKEIEEINHKEKMMQKIYEVEKSQGEQKTPKVSSHQSRHRRESEQFLRMVKQHRKIKEQEQIEFQDIDRHITNNLLELNKMRQENEEKKKEQKRLQIMERMKKNELRKLNEQKQMKANNHYVQQFKADGAQHVPKTPPKQNFSNPPENLFQKKKTKNEEGINLDIVSQPLREQPRPKIAKIKSLSRKVEIDKYENKLN